MCQTEFALLLLFCRCGNRSRNSACSDDGGFGPHLSDSLDQLSPAPYVIKELRRFSRRTGGIEVKAVTRLARLCSFSCHICISSLFYVYAFLGFSNVVVNPPPGFVIVQGTPPASFFLFRNYPPFSMLFL